MTSERHEELAALHSLGLLEGAEKVAFEAELAADPGLRDLVRTFRSTSAALALAAPTVEPPARLRDRVLATAASTTVRPAPGARRNNGGKVVTGVFSRVTPWAVAAGLAIVATWLAAYSLSLRSANDNLRTERELIELALKMSSNQLTEQTLLAENMINELGRKLQRHEDLTRLKVTALAALAGDTKEAQAIAVWDPDLQSGLMTIDKLPAIAETQDYQIWVVDPAYPNPVDGGVFRPDASGKARLTFKGDKPVKAVSAFAISIEKKGGVPKAEGPIVLLGK